MGYHCQHTRACTAGQGQPRFNPVRAPYGIADGFPVARSNDSWSILPTWPPYGIYLGMPSPSFTERATMGFQPATQHGCHFKFRLGPVRDLYGDHGASRACPYPYGANSNPLAKILVHMREPGQYPVIGPVRDLTGHSIVTDMLTA